MSQRHAVPARGLDLLDVINPSKQADTVNFGARFGRMFADLPAATFGKTEGEVFKNLEFLAAKMVASFDAPKDGPDDEESGIPSLYTYLGQFIDHDLTFDPDGSFQKQKDPNATEDFRTPAFDLDNIYGRGPGDQPYLYDEDDKHFLLGDPLMMGTPGARDLQRNGSGRALIGDPRNDENAIVSQLQGLFLRFHNQDLDAATRAGRRTDCRGGVPWAGFQRKGSVQPCLEAGNTELYSEGFRSIRARSVVESSCQERQDHLFPI
jgi:hypothetical protein